MRDSAISDATPNRERKAWCDWLKVSKLIPQSKTTRPTTNRKKKKLLTLYTAKTPDRFGVGLESVWRCILCNISVTSHRQPDSTPSRNDIHNAYRGQTGSHLYPSKMDVSSMHGNMWGNTEVGNTSATSVLRGMWSRRLLFLSFPPFFLLFSVSVLL